MIVRKKQHMFWGIATVIVLTGSLLWTGCGGQSITSSSSSTSVTTSTATFTTSTTTAITTTPTAPPISFGSDVFPILRSKCGLCHMDGAALGELNLDASVAYLKLVNAPSLQSALKIVMPGYPNESYLFHKISGTHLQVGGSGTRMPPVTPLSEANIGLISQWISQGASEK